MRKIFICIISEVEALMSSCSKKAPYDLSSSDFLPSIYLTIVLWVLFFLSFSLWDFKFKCCFKSHKTALWVVRHTVQYNRDLSFLSISKISLVSESFNACDGFISSPHPFWELLVLLLLLKFLISSVFFSSLILSIFSTSSIFQYFRQNLIFPYSQQSRPLQSCLFSFQKTQNFLSFDILNFHCTFSRLNSFDIISIVNRLVNFFWKK